MRKFLRGLGNLNNWLALVPVLFFFVVISLEIFSRNTVAIITNGLDIGGAILLDFALIPAWIKLLRRSREMPEAYLFGGILLIVNAVAASRVWSWGIIVSGKPEWMLNHWFQSFCYLMVGLGMFYLLKIPSDGKAGLSSYRYIAYGLVAAVIVMVWFLIYWE